MKILFDHNVDRRFRRHLVPHEIRTAREMGWDRLANGALLRAAASNGFGAVLTIDKNIEYEQNLSSLPLPVILLDSPSNALPALLPFVPAILQLLQTAIEPVLYVIQPSGSVIRLTAPRRI